LVAEPLHVGTVSNVRTGHCISEIDQHLGNAAHANAADADEMHQTDVARQLHGFALSPSIARLRAPSCLAGDARPKQGQHKWLMTIFPRLSKQARPASQRRRLCPPFGPPAPYSKAGTDPAP